MSEDRLYPNLAIDTMVAGLDLESPGLPEPPTPLSPEEEDDSPPEHPLLSKIKSKIVNEIKQEQLEILRLIEPKYDNKLYNLQQSAPKPRSVKARYQDDDKPPYYGDEYHGMLKRPEVDRLLGTKDGNYIVRESMTKPGKYSLSFVYDGAVRHFILEYKDGEHVIGDKSFESIDTLVHDGLISFHVAKHGVEQIIAKSITLRRIHKRKAPPPPSAPPIEDNITDDESGNDEEIDGKSADRVELRVKRNKNMRKTVRVSEYFELSRGVEKKHNFKKHTYYGFPFCDYCSNYMWGLSQQGCQCVDCGQNCHHQCAEQAPPDCKPSAKLISKVFGVDLTSVVMMNSTENIPAVLHKCFQVIEKIGLEKQGIYRVNGSHDDILRYKEMMNKNASLSVLETVDLFVLCSLTKMFLRELPMPLITYDAYQPFIDGNSLFDHDNRVGQTKNAIRILPSCHFYTLRALTQHLNTVSKTSDKNQMTAENLAIVFGPTVFRTEVLTAENMMADLNAQKSVMKFLIDHCWRLFA